MRVTRIVFWAAAALLGCGALPTAAEQLRADAVTPAPDQVITVTHKVYQGNALFAFQNFTLAADRFDVYRTGGLMKKLVATGHVRLVIRKAPLPARCTATGDRATYDVTQDEIKVQGGVTLVAYGWSMSGDWTKPRVTTIKARTVTYKPDEFPDLGGNCLGFTPTGSSDEHFFVAMNPEKQYGGSPGRRRPSRH